MARLRHNRTEALELAEDKAEYLLFMDADKVLRTPADFAFRRSGRRLLARIATRAPSSSRCAWPTARVALGGRAARVRHGLDAGRAEGSGSRGRTSSHEGARARPQDLSQGRGDPRSGADREPDNARYMFYLAQSLRDAGEPAARDAIPPPGRDARLDEERWNALYQAACTTRGWGSRRRRSSPRTSPRTSPAARAPSRCSSSPASTASAASSRALPLRAAGRRASRAPPTGCSSTRRLRLARLDEQALPARTSARSTRASLAAQRLLSENRFPTCRAAADRGEPGRPTGLPIDSRKGAGAAHRRDYNHRHRPSAAAMNACWEGPLDRVEDSNDAETRKCPQPDRRRVLRPC